MKISSALSSGRCLSLAFILVLVACNPVKEAEPASNPGKEGTSQSTEVVQSPRAQVALGEIHYLDSSAMGERRELNIYLPPNYAEAVDATFPVIYLLDGAVHEDYHHVTGLVQFLVAYQLMPPSIVVGIANIDRYRDFTYPSEVARDKEALPTSGGSEKFRHFLASELKPYIEKEFRTKGPATLIGQSLGGLVATEIFMKTPNLFDHYLIVSPSLWWDGGRLIEGIDGVLENYGQQKTAVYISLGTEGDQMQVGVDRFVASLQKNAPDNLTWHYVPLPEETHATILHRALYHGFEKIYEKTHPGL